MKTLFRDRLIERLQRLGVLFPVLLSIGYIEISLGFLPSLPYPLVISLILCCVAFALLKGRIRVDTLCLAFLVIIPVTIVLAEPRAIFRSWERFGAFAMAFTFTSALLQNQTIRRYRKTAFYVFLLMATIIGSLSFFAYFLGINYMSTEEEVIDEYLQNAGTFGGLTKHSMMLGPLSGLGTVAMMFLFFKTKKWYYLVPAGLCAFSVLFSASRSALLSMLIGFVVLVYTQSGGWRPFVKKLSIVLLVLITTYPLWGSAMDSVKEKHQRHAGETELFDSRSDKIECRLLEFENSPIWGVGFSAIEPKFKDNYGENGTIEPGSSWLGVLSMTGLVGLSFVIAMLSRGLKGLWRNREKSNSLVLACLLLLSTHMVVEGYIFASGNPLSYIFWLMVGLGTDVFLDRPSANGVYRRYGNLRKINYRRK